MGRIHPSKWRGFHESRWTAPYPGVFFRAEAIAPAPQVNSLLCDCRLILAFDVGFEIDLERAARILGARGSTHSVAHPRRVRIAQDTPSAALRIERRVRPVKTPAGNTAARAQLTLHRFGVISLTYRLALEGSLAELRMASSQLVEVEALRQAAEVQLAEIMLELAEAVKRPSPLQVVEDYRVFVLSGSGAVPAKLEDQREMLAGLLRGEVAPLAEDEIQDALSETYAVRAGTAIWVDWLAAILLGPDLEKEFDVLELATSELTAMRFLDRQLQKVMDRSYHVGAGSKARKLPALYPILRQELEALGTVGADLALLREVADNPLKLMGDPSLARLHDAAARRFRFDALDQAASRKLEAVREVFHLLDHRREVRRSEMLEWIIIILIAVDIVFLVI